MSGPGGDRHSRAAMVAAREKERQVIQLFIRGLTFVEIARQLGYNDHAGALKAFNRAVKRIPPKDVEMLRKLQSERMDDARRRIYTELAGREVDVPDGDNPGRTKKITMRPDPIDVGALVGRLLNVEQHEAELYGLYAPKRSEINAAVKSGTGQAFSDEELDVMLARLTPEEQQTFLQLWMKANGRWVEPPALEDQGTTIETTATNTEGDANGNG